MTNGFTKNPSLATIVHAVTNLRDNAFKMTSNALIMNNYVIRVHPLDSGFVLITPLAKVLLPARRRFPLARDLLQISVFGLAREKSISVELTERIGSLFRCVIFRVNFR